MLKTSKLLKKGLNKNLINKISHKYRENILISKFRYQAFCKLKNLKNPDWAYIEIPEFDFDNISYYSKLKNTELKPIIFENLNIDVDNSKQALDLIFDSVSIIQTIKPILIKLGILFMPLFEVSRIYSYLVFKYLGNLVSMEDNFYAALNSMVFSEGSFCYIPKDIKCEFDLSTYFRTNTDDFAQFERSLIIASENSQVTYLEGCTAPNYIESQLHIAIIEIFVKPHALVNYTTIQNWYRGNQLGEGGVYNFTTKRGICFFKAGLIWTQVEIGSIFTWKYPSTILKGDFSYSKFLSLALVSNVQDTDTGTKMIHIGKHSKSQVLAKSISLNTSISVYRGLINITPTAKYSYNSTECNSLLLSKNSLTVTLPYIIVSNSDSMVQQEAYITKIDLLYLLILLQRGIPKIKALNLLILGFCSSISEKLPTEYNVEIPYLITARTEDAFC
eukprot:GHVT01023789.1.p1 GENE.GHVT01023789.1~~GHVT01023789.1.p1  ORF type:complete len:446 (+),score=-40.64 GHVT01023789.1:3466-4803(+)